MMYLEPWKGQSQDVLHIMPGVSPWFRKACSLLSEMVPLVEQELDRLVAEGIIEPVQFAYWAAPMSLSLNRTKSQSGSVMILNLPLILFCKLGGRQTVHTP